MACGDDHPLMALLKCVLQFFYFGVYFIKIVLSLDYVKGISLKNLIRDFHNIRWLLLLCSLICFPFPFCLVSLQSCVFVFVSQFCVCLYFLFQVTHVIVINTFFFTYFTWTITWVCTLRGLSRVRWGNTILKRNGFRESISFRGGPSVFWYFG